MSLYLGQMGVDSTTWHMSMPARANSVRDTPCRTIFIYQLGTTAFKPDCRPGPRLEGALEDSP